MKKPKKTTPKEDQPVFLEDDTGNIYPFKVLQGGRLGLDPKPPDEGNWLSPLNVRTHFLVKDRRSADYVLQEFELIDKTNYSVLLKTEINQKIFIWVCPFRFCQKYDLQEILGEFKSND